MIRYVLASHGTLAEGMKSSIELIMGDRQKIETLCAYIDDSNIHDQIKEVMSRNNPKETLLVITDLFGGSVNNAFLEYLQDEKFYLIAGMNLSLLLQLMLIKDEDDFSKSILNIIEASKESILYCNDVVENLQLEESDF
ncbi:TPA: PTS sugar transporter subunit IIA [Enterococcus faecium]